MFRTTFVPGAYAWQTDGPEGRRYWAQRTPSEHAVKFHSAQERDRWLTRQDTDTDMLVDAHYGERYE